MFWLVDSLCQVTTHNTISCRKVEQHLKIMSRRRKRDDEKIERLSVNGTVSDHSNPSAKINFLHINIKH